jgi:hypothetical protein
MGTVAQAVIRFHDRIPGFALRSRNRDGRMRTPLRALVLVSGTSHVACGTLIGVAAYRGFDSGNINLFLSILVGVAGAWVLAAGARCAVFALRNPSPPALPDNVIPLFGVHGAAPRRASND